MQTVFYFSTKFKLFCSFGPKLTLSVRSEPNHGLELSPTKIYVFEKRRECFFQFFCSTFLNDPI